MTRDPLRAVSAQAQGRMEGESLHLDHDGLRLHALSWPGCEPALVIVPGITSPAATWAFVVQALRLPNRVIVLDLRGRGLSDARLGQHGLGALASDLGAWITGLGLVRPLVLGHSMGAMVVARLAAEKPGSLGAIAIVDPPLSGPGRDAYPLPLDFYLKGIDAARAGELTLDGLRAGSPGWSDARLQDRIDWLGSCDPEAIAAAHAFFHDHDILTDLSGLSVPGIVIRGAKSPVVTEAGAVDLRNANPGLAQHCIAGAGHMIPWDNLPDFCDAVRSWTAATAKDTA